MLERQVDLEVALSYLHRLGFDQIEGYLCGGFEEWQNAALPIESFNSMSVKELKDKLERREKLLVLDVRAPHEWASGHIAEAKNTYVGYLKQDMPKLPKDHPVASLCSVGRRGSLGASLLHMAGFKNVYNVLGGMAAWEEADYPTVSERK